MRIYAVSVSASNAKDRSVNITTMPVRTIDDDERSVREAAMQECHRLYPLSDGYADHQIILAEIPHDWIVEAAGSQFTDKVTVDNDVWDVEIGNLD